MNLSLYGVMKGTEEFLFQILNDWDLQRADLVYQQCVWLHG